MKDTFEKKFKKLYPKKRLLAIQLNGFSHSVIYDSGKRDTPIEQSEFSGYMTDHERAYYGEDEQNKLATLFEGVGHTSYQNNAKEIVYIMPEDR